MLPSENYICFKCEHYGKPAGKGCRAFPEGIPYHVSVILAETNKHNKQFPEQTNEYIFKKKRL